MLKQRVITALILAALVLALILLAPPWLFVASMAALLMVGAWEWSALSGYGGREARAAYTLLFGFLAGFTQFFAVYTCYRAEMLLCTLGAVWWLFDLGWLAFGRWLFPRALKAAAGLLTLLPAFVAVVALWLAGARYLVILLLLVAGADIGAYFAGRAFGRRKLAPSVSPGKTWEGVAGGVALSAAVAAVVWRWLPVELGPFILIGMVISLISVVGDLSESLFKRQAGLKDSGTLFPGHGGLLDRVDSLSAAAPLFWLGLHWLKALP
ncbi:MAG TPA: phosphatidate cytidylyltransferase [Gammaproteobacteria bacterium]|nr:phosphatidate cytidylyltransferase [Gammaproteobacteria bacterium]